MVRYILLGLLRSGAARHGYALMKEYRSRSGSRVLGGRFYREIRRLVGEGLVCPTAKAPGADARRLPYEITAAGAAEFDSWLANVGVAGGRLDDELYALAAIVGEAVPSSGDAALRRWHEELCIRRAQIEEARQATSTERARHPTALDPLPLILDHRLRRVTADVEFLEKLRAEYEKSAGLPSLSMSPPRASCGRKGVDVERPLTPSRPREAANRVTDTKLRAASPGCNQPRGRPSRSR